MGDNPSQLPQTSECLRYHGESRQNYIFQLSGGEACGCDPDPALYEQTLLSLAARKGHQAVVHLLLEKGTCLESKCDLSRTSLSYAVGNGHTEVVNLLLQEGVNREASK